MSGSGSGPLVPTFHGFVHNSMDGLVLFEACLSGKLHHVPRRPHDRERGSLIKSGNIFIYEENASGIKRWTDGVAWSPSRILGNFLIYRELEKPFPPGEKKRAMKRKRSSQLDGQSDPRDSEPTENSEVHMPPTPPSPKPQPAPQQHHQQDAPVEPGQENERELERQLIGSLVDSYGFRPDGLVKKTMSIAINGISHHLVSYYKVDDVKNRVLTRPLNDQRLSGITVRPELYLKQNFRTPVEETEHYVVDPSNMHAHPGMPYNPVMGGYAMRQGYMPQAYPMYAMPAASGAMYASTPTTAWPTTQQHQMTAQYPGHPYAQQQQQQQYADYYNRTSSAAPQQPASAVKSEDNSAAAASSSYGHYSNPASYHSRPTSTSYTNYQSPARPGSSSGYSQHAQPQHSSPNPGSSHSTQPYGVTSAPGHSQYNAQAAAGSSYTSQSHVQAPSEHMRSPAVGSGPMPSLTHHSSQMAPYRYAAHDGTATSNVTGLGLGTSYSTSAAPQAAPSYAPSYGGYNAPSGYRQGVDANNAVPSASHY
ncbi:hypothetical protein MBLNU457_g0791t1 [Dothideomycetes sp. NU457]